MSNDILAYKVTAILGVASGIAGELIYGSSSSLGRNEVANLLLATCLAVAFSSVGIAALVYYEFYSGGTKGTRDRD